MYTRTRLKVLFFFQVKEVLAKCKSNRRFSSCLNNPPIIDGAYVALFYYFRTWVSGSYTGLHNTKPYGLPNHVSPVCDVSGEFGVYVELAGWFLPLLRPLGVLTYRTPVLFTRCLSRAMSLPCLLVLPRYEREHCDFV